MADEAEKEYPGDITPRTEAADVPGASDQVKENAASAKDRHGDDDVVQVEDVARDSGDPYFGEFADDPDDNRASAGVREPRPIDRATERLL